MFPFTISCVDTAVKELFELVVSNCASAFASATPCKKSGDLVSLKQAALTNFRVLALLWTSYGKVKLTARDNSASQYNTWVELVRGWFGVGVETDAKSKKRGRTADVGSTIPFPGNLDAKSRVLLNLLGIQGQDNWDSVAAHPGQLELLSAFLGESFHFAAQTLNGTFVVCC
jgi:hypothetical protein